MGFPTTLNFSNIKIETGTEATVSIGRRAESLFRLPGSPLAASLPIPLFSSLPFSFFPALFVVLVWTWQNGMKHANLYHQPTGLRSSTSTANLALILQTNMLTEVFMLRRVLFWLWWFQVVLDIIDWNYWQWPKPEVKGHLGPFSAKIVPFWSKWISFHENFEPYHVHRTSCSLYSHIETPFELFFVLQEAKIVSFFTFFHTLGSCKHRSTH